MHIDQSIIIHLMESHLFQYQNHKDLKVKSEQYCEFYEILL